MKYSNVIDCTQDYQKDVIQALQNMSYFMSLRFCEIFRDNDKIFSKEKINFTLDESMQKFKGKCGHKIRNIAKPCK